MAVAPVGRAYVLAQRRLRDQVAVRLSRLYADGMDPDDIPGSFDRVAVRSAPVVVAGQSHAAVLVQGLVRAQTGAVALAVPDLAGKLAAARDGMAAIGPLVLTAIADGRTLQDAMAYGDYLLGRFGTNEVIKAADDEQQRMAAAVSSIVGWEGVVSSDACDNCQANAGPHDLSEEMWRHGNCGCERLPVYGSA